MALPEHMALPQQLAEGDFRQAEKQKDQNTQEGKSHPEKPEPRTEPGRREGESQEGDEDQEGPREALEKPEPRAKPGGREGKSQE